PRIYAKIVDMNNNGAFMKMSEDRGVQFMIYYTDGNGGIAEDEYSFDYDRNYYYAPIPANSLDPGYYTATVMVGESGSVIASASKTINVWE
ncbi:MAG: hypothetical protein KKG59_05445, partial [Nanoarchaeota archaeon]|nr:hypothetical protein [Nanoarchaeota archaeon]